MKKSYGIFVFLSLILVSSCGKSGGGGGSQGSSPVADQVPATNGCLKMREKTSLKAIAVEANRARIECGLSEEDLVAEMIRP